MVVLFFFFLIWFFIWLVTVSIADVQVQKVTLNVLGFQGICRISDSMKAGKGCENISVGTVLL